MTESPPIHHEVLSLGPFETNGYVVWHGEGPGGPGGGGGKGGEGRECWIVDAPPEAERLAQIVTRRGLKPTALVLTHAHADHIAGVFALRRAFPRLPIWIHEAEAEWLNDPELNLSAAIGMPVTAPAADRLLKHDDELALGGQIWRVLHTPGHSPGGIALYHGPSKVAIVGDAIFSGSVGRTDFPGSSQDQLFASIRAQIYSMPNETALWPGHGPATTVGRERRSNPFVRD